MKVNKIKVIIVVFSIGEEYINKFHTYFLKNLVDYCNRYGYELQILDHLIDTTRYPSGQISKKEFFWQRLLVPNQFLDYDYVISMDTDIFINPDAPPLPLDKIPPGKVGAVNERKYMQNYEWRETVQCNRGWEKTGKEWYALSGFDRNYNDHINAGMIIYQPTYHAEILVKLYNENIENYKNFHQDDQSILSVFLMDNNMIHWLDERYNRLWCFWKDIFYPNFEELPEDVRRLYVRNFTRLNYFTHFTSGIDVIFLSEKI